MEPLFQTSLMGFRVFVYPDRVAYRKMWSGEQSVPLSQIASVTVAMMGVQQVTIETTGGKKIKMPVALSDKDKLRDAIFAAQSGTKPQHVAGPAQDETKAKKGAKAVSRVEGAQEEGKKGLRRVLAWVVGIAFAMTGLAVFGEHTFKAIILLACAALLIPPVVRKIEKGGLIMSRWSRVLVYVVGFIVAVGLSGNGEEKLNGVQPQKEAQQAQPQKTSNPTPEIAAPTTSSVMPTTVNKDAAEKELKEFMDLSIKANLVESYEFSNKATVVYVGFVWYTQTVTFKKDFLAKVAMLKKAVTGYGHFEVRDARSNEKVAEVTAFSQSLEVYK